MNISWGKEVKKTKCNKDRKTKLNDSQLKLVEDNILLAYSRANKMFKKYKSFNLSIKEDDFCSYALEALCDAAMRYDKRKNFAFSTFAVSYIDNYIKTYVFYENPTIKIPSYSPDKDKMNKFRHMALTNALCLSTDNGILDADGNCIDTNPLTFKGEIDNGYKCVEDALYLNYISNNLSEKDKQLLECLVIKDLNVSDVANHLNIHINTVCRRKKKIANVIKSKMF